MKLPNGFGSVVKQSGNRRKPYAVRKTVGWEYDQKRDKMVQKIVTIGYAKTRAEGIQMLAEYNDRPFDVTSSGISFSQVYKAWAAEKFPSISHSNKTGYIAAYKACNQIHDSRFREIKLADLQKVIDTCGKNYPTLKKIKTLMNQLYDYAMRNEIVNRDHSDYVNILKHKDKNPNKLERDRFSAEELSALWSMKDDPYYQIILMSVYNGTRVSEFLGLLKEDVFIDEQYFNVRKSKTESGIRKVPIADKTLVFYKSWMGLHEECQTLLSTPDGKPFKYRNYYESYWIPLMEKIGLPSSRTPHWTRHTCASLMADVGISPTLQKLILGHSGAMNLTERVYTHIDTRVLVDAINQI